MARWGGALLLCLAIELLSFSVQLVASPVSPNFLGYVLQVISFNFLTILWLLFIFEISDFSKRLNLHLILIILCLPAVFLTILLSTAQGQFSNNPGIEMIGSLSQLPSLIGPYGSFLLAFLISIGILSILFLFRLYRLPNRYNQKLALPMLFGTIFIMLLCGAESVGVNPIKPVPMTQMGLAMISIAYFYITVVWRFGGILPISRESVFEGMNDAVLILDYYNNVIDANQPAQKIIGMNRKSIINHKLSTIWPLGAHVIDVNSAKVQTENEITLSVEGQEYIFDLLVTKFIGLNNVPTGSLILLRNITSRERMEKALSQKAQEIQRMNTFMAALAKVNVALQSAAHSSQINATLGAELKKLGLFCFIAQLNPDTNELMISYLSDLPEIAARIEKVLKGKIIGYGLARKQFSLFYEILESKEIRFDKYNPSNLGSGQGLISINSVSQIVQWIGLQPEMPALILPLFTAERNLGVMSVWGGNFRVEDIPSFQIFASQVSHVMERAFLYEKETQRSSELARSNNLVIALTKVASVLGSASSSELVLDTLGKELKNTGLNCAVVTIDSAGEAAYIKYLSFSPEIIRQIEKIIGLNIVNYAIPRRFWPGDRILTQQMPIWYPNPGEYFRKLFHGLPQAAYKRSEKIINFSEDDQICILPLNNGNLTIGGLVIWGPKLKTTDSPILSVFGSQVASIIQNLTNYESEIQRKDELIRSNAMIIALSNVAAQLDTTTNLPQVFETLGKEMKKIHINCMVGTLDEAKQNMRIDYLSINENLTSLVEKLEKYWPKEITIPRRLWPTEKVVTNKEPYWDPDPIASTLKMFPWIPKQVFEKTFEMAGMNPNDRVCYLPMINEEDVIGILAVWGHDLNLDDIPGLSVFANQVAYAIRNTRLYDHAQKEISERTLAETRVREALKEKEVLLKEIHHRVKNNLQVISSLLSLQSAQIKDPVTVQLFRDSQNRVRSMALIHEKLYQSHDLARIDFKGYVQSLSSYLVRSFAAEARGITFRLDVDPIELGIDQAIPCGLIINELVSNSLKYAFPNDRKGEVSISFRKEKGNQFCLEVGDNGVGFPAHIDFQNTASLGLQLVNSLVKQLDGTVELRRSGGTEFHIWFSELESWA
jgi:PAS domain S-box-containing protein